MYPLLHRKRWRKLSSARLLGAVLLLAAWSASCGPPASKLGETRVANFEFRGGDLCRDGVVHRFPGDIREAAVKLAQQVKVPICFEPAEVGIAVPTVPIHIDVHNTNVGAILAAMVRQDPRYVYRERLGVIEVLPVGAAEDAKNCLNMTIPVLRVKYPWPLAIGSVRCQIANVSRSHFNLVFDPVRSGCSGRMPVRAKDKPIRATFLFQPVRDILDQIVAESGEAAWLAGFSKPSKACDSLIIGAYRLTPE